MIDFVVLMVQKVEASAFGARLQGARGRIVAMRKGAAEILMLERVTFELRVALWEDLIQRTLGPVTLQEIRVDLV